MNRLLIETIFIFIIKITLSFSQLYGTNDIDIGLLRSITTELPQISDEKSGITSAVQPSTESDENQTKTTSSTGRFNPILTLKLLFQNLFPLIISIITLVTLIVIIYLLEKGEKRIVRLINDGLFQKEEDGILAELGQKNIEVSSVGKINAAYDGLDIILNTVKMQFINFVNLKPENGLLQDNTSIVHRNIFASNNAENVDKIPILLKQEGVFKALEALFDQVNVSTNVKAVIDINVDIQRIQENREILLLRIIRELLEYTIKYARATNISLIISKFNEALRIQYSDNGIGFNKDEMLKNDSYLKTIDSQIRYLNGEIEIDSAPGKGTMFFINFPI